MKDATFLFVIIIFALIFGLAAGAFLFSGAGDIQSLELRVAYQSKLIGAMGATIAIQGRQEKGRK